MPYCPRCDAPVEPDAVRCGECRASLERDGARSEPDRDHGRDRTASRAGAGVVGTRGLPRDESLPQERRRLVAFAATYPAGAGAGAVGVPLALWSVAAILGSVLATAAAVWILVRQGTLGLLVVPALLVALPGVAVLGYGVGVGDAAAGGAPVPPAFSGLYGLLAEGVYAAFALTPWAIGAGLAIGAAASIAEPLAVPVAAVAAYALPAIAVEYAVTGDVVAAYRPGRLAALLGSRGYVAAAVIALPATAGGLVLVGLSVFVPFATFAAVPYVLYAAFAYWGAVRYRLAGRGVVPPAGRDATTGPAAGEPGRASTVEE